MDNFGRLSCGNKCHNRLGKNCPTKMSAKGGSIRVTMLTCATSNFCPSWKVQITGESGSTVSSTVGFWDNSRGPRNLGPLTSFLQAQRCSSLHPISNPIGAAAVGAAAVGAAAVGSAAPELCCTLFSSAGSKGEALEVDGLCLAPGREDWHWCGAGLPLHDMLVSSFGIQCLGSLVHLEAGRNRQAKMTVGNGLKAT